MGILRGGEFEEVDLVVVVGVEGVGGVPGADSCLNGAVFLGSVFC
jgi:hypothetical protein